MNLYKNIVKMALLDGRAKQLDIGFLLKCPRCGNWRKLKTRENVRRGLKYNKNCNSCSRSIIQSNKPHDEKRKISMSLAQKKRYSDIKEIERTRKLVKQAMHRPNVRKKHLNALAETKWLGKPVDRGQIELLKKWNRLGFNFEPNYQLKTDDFLCYIDGYDKEKNVVLEYDSKYHNNLRQKEKDLIRQNKIINILKPKKFWRFDAIMRKVNNIYISYE